MKNKSDSSAENTRKAPVSRREFFTRTPTGVVALGLMSGVGLAAPKAPEQAIGSTGLQGGERGVFPGQTPQTAHVSQGKKLRDLLARKGVVLAVLGVPDAAGAVKMEAAGCECAFIGTGLLFQRFGGLPGSRAWSRLQNRFGFPSTWPSPFTCLSSWTATPAMVVRRR